MTNRRFALALFVAAIVAGVTGPMVLPQGLIWVTVGVLLWAAGTIWYRTVDWSARRADSEPTVMLTLAADLPLAEEICSGLRGRGIDAFWIGEEEDGTAQVWVSEKDLVQAKAWLEQVSDTKTVSDT